MLESLPSRFLMVGETLSSRWLKCVRLDRVSPTENLTLSPCASFRRFATFFGRTFCPASSSLSPDRERLAPANRHRTLPELSRGAPGAFLAAVAVVAKQPRHRVARPKEMHLEAVRFVSGREASYRCVEYLFRIGLALFSGSLAACSL